MYKLTVQWQKAAFGLTDAAEHICTAPNHQCASEGRRIAHKTLFERGLETPQSPVWGHFSKIRRWAGRTVRVRSL